MIKVASTFIQIALHGNEVIEVVKFGNVCTPAGKVADVFGTVIIMNFVVGNHYFLKSRELYKCLDFKDGWDEVVLVSQDAVSEIKF